MSSSNSGGILMRVHLTYLLVLPLAGLVGLTLVSPQSTGIAHLGGWIPAVVYLAFQCKYYRLDANPLKAAIVIGVVPVQIAVHVVLFGGGWADFFIEETFIELASLAIALALVMLAYQPSGIAGAVVGVVLAAIAVAGFGWPLVQRYAANGTHPAFYGLLVVVMLTGVWAHVRFTAPAARGRAVPLQPGAHGGLIRRLVDGIAPGDNATVGLQDPDRLVSALVIVMLVVWLAAPPLMKVLL